MDATIKIKCNPQNAVPAEGRVAWLDEHGVLPTEAVVTVTVPLAVWEVAGARITSAGEVQAAEFYSEGQRDWRVDEDLKAHLLGSIHAEIVATGKVPLILSATTLEAFAFGQAARARAKREAADQKEAERLADVQARIDLTIARTASTFVCRENGRISARMSVAHVYNTAGGSPGKSEALDAKAREVEGLATSKSVEEDRLGDACEAALRLMATREDDLARAATEGYAVAGPMLDRLTMRAAEALHAVIAPSAEVELVKLPGNLPFKGFSFGIGGGKALHVLPDRLTFGGIGGAGEDRNAPNAASFRLLDACKGVAKAAELPVAVGAWKASRILRLDVCKHSGETHYVTAVLLTLETPSGDREITCSFESLACKHGEDDEEG